MPRSLLLLLLAACGSSTATPAEPESSPTAEAAAPIDAAPVDAAPDAGLPPEVAAAPAWVFRYTTAARKERWSLRWASGYASLVVETTGATIRYTGTVTEGATTTFELVAPGNQQRLTCTKKSGSYAADPCAKKPALKPTPVFECFLPGYDAPMTFGAEPGLEFVGDAACNGYRLITP